MNDFGWTLAVPVTLPSVEPALSSLVSLDFAMPTANQPEIALLEPMTTLSMEQTQAMVLAQYDQDILGDMANAWNTFIDSGQVWALMIGLVIGYLVRGITAY